MSALCILAIGRSIAYVVQLLGDRYSNDDSRHLPLHVLRFRPHVTFHQETVGRKKGVEGKVVNYIGDQFLTFDMQSVKQKQL